MDKTILQLKDYGFIQVNLRSLMDERGINRNQLAQSIHARYEVINKWYSGHVERIDADILARLCYALDCSVSDLLEYKEP